MLSIQMETSLPENSASQGEKTQVFDGKEKCFSRDSRLKMNKGLTILLKKPSYAHLLIYNILTYIDFPICKKA